MRVRLIDPHGNSVVAGGGVEIIEVDTHTVIKMPFMDRGTWTLELESAGGGDTPFFAALAGQQIFGANLFVKVGGPTGDKRLDAYRWGQKIPIIASLTDRDGAIRRADVMSAITHPDSTVIHLPLLDDGNHGDGQADDGVYGNTYTRTTEYATRGADNQNPRPNGSYVVRVVAHGIGNLGDKFHRIENGAFSLYENGDPSPDVDGDKVADLFESYHSCMKSTDPSDVAADPDEDQLPSGDEWFYGTDPCHPDTDRGGEPDLSEIKRGANPFDPRDDALPRPEDPSVIDRPIDHIGRPDLKRNSLLIRYPAHPSYATIRLWRAVHPNGPFHVVAEFDSLANGGQYRDRGLINDTTYWYKLEGIDFSGNPSTPSPVFSGTPKKEPMPPIGHVVINAGRPYTPIPQVKLALGVDDKDVIRMMVSNDGQFSGAVWEPFARTKAWTLAPGIGGFSTVFVKYQDKAGNESNVVTDEITVSLGLISVSGRVKPDVLPTDGSLAGIQMTLIDHPNQPSVVTNAHGRFTFRNLLPGGTYTVQALGAGYATSAPVTLSTTSVQVVPVKCDGSC